MKKEELIIIILFLIVFLVCAGFIYYLTTFEGRYFDQSIYYEMDNFCHRRGYEKATDSNDYMSKIECDYVKIFDVNKTIVCLEKDKWNVCLRSNFEFY